MLIINRQAVSGIIQILLFISMLTLAFNVEMTKAAPSEPPAIEWDKTYGGASADMAEAVKQTDDGGYLVAGATWSFGAGMADFWLVKTDTNGNMQWNKTYGGADWDWAESVQQTSDGGYVIAGGTKSFGGGDCDFWLVKIDADGNMQWNKPYGGAHWDMAYSVQQTSDGGYVIVGQTDSFGIGADVWLVKTDSAGNMQWQRTYGGADVDGARSVQQTSDGGYIVAGVTRSFGVGSFDFWLIKTDANGHMMWYKTYGWGRLGRS